MPKWFFKTLALIGLAFILVFLIIGNFRLNQKRQQFNSVIKGLEDEIIELRQQREDLQAKIVQSQTEEYSEKIAREEYNLKKAGEKVVAFPMVEEVKEVMAPVEESSFWQEFLERFKIR